MYTADARKTLIFSGQGLVHFASGEDVDRLTELFAKPHVSSTGVLTWNIPPFIAALNFNVRR